jgi:hypothetical protein
MFPALRQICRHAPELYVGRSAVEADESLVHQSEESGPAAAAKS